MLIQLKNYKKISTREDGCAIYTLTLIRKLKCHFIVNTPTSATIKIKLIQTTTID